MDMYDVISTKRDGGKLTKEQIDFFVEASVTGQAADYQISAMLMAMFINGLDKEETIELTRAMRDSGETLDLSGIDGIKVDKHSTGGVGDKTTLIAAPLAAACGVPVAKMSGRGLGFTGGTIDKLQSIPGFNVALSTEEFIKQVNLKGLSVIGQTAHVAAADKIFYALRDVTATVDNISLITSSIMSKKLALGCDAILLDVKCGKAAFMKTEEKAAELGRMMTEIGNSFGRKTVAMISSMDQPLGNAVGNSLEVIEAIQTLKGKGPEDITELSVALAGIMVYLSGLAINKDDGIKKAETALKDGLGLEKLKEMITAQGGNSDVCDDYSLLPGASVVREVVCETDGYVNNIDGLMIGNASMHAGAGRQTAEDEIDPGAGIVLEKKEGDHIGKGAVLCRVYSNSEEKAQIAAKEAAKAFIISDDKCSREPLIRSIIE